MFYHFAYSLLIESEIALLELQSAPPADADIRVRLAPAITYVRAHSIEWRDGPNPEARLSFPGAGRFVIKSGHEILVEPEPGVDPALLRLYIEGMMLAAALHQRGYFVMHSSVVKIAGQAVALIGPAGAGKSSTAAALHARGHAVVADDNAAIDQRAASPCVVPGFPTLKLYPDVAVFLGFERDSLKELHHSQIKQAQSVSSGFSPDRVPLAAIYVLDQTANADVSNLSSITIVTELIRHSVPIRWGASGDGRHLRNCAELANAVPVFRVRTFTELSELPGVAELIERHFLSLDGTSRSRLVPQQILESARS